jgi:hypothetical protein
MRIWSLQLDLSNYGKSYFLRLLHSKLIGCGNSQHNDQQQLAKECGWLEFYRAPWVACISIDKVFELVKRKSVICKAISQDFTYMDI